MTPATTIHSIVKGCKNTQEMVNVLLANFTRDEMMRYLQTYGNLWIMR